MVDTSFLSDEERGKALDAKLSLLSQGEQERLAQMRAEKLGLPYVSLVMFHINSEVLERVSREDAEHARAILFFKSGKDIRLAVIDPDIPEVKELTADLKKRLGYAPQVYIMSLRSLQTSLSRYLPDDALKGTPKNELHISREKVAGFERDLTGLQELGKRIMSLPPTEILSSITASAVHMRASDIHIEPTEHNARLRFRIDGVLQDITDFSREGWALVLSRVKVMAHLKLNVNDIPQDGSFILRIVDDVYDMRLSVLPGGYGENIVVRLLNRNMETVKLTDLGMKKRDYDVSIAELRRSNGMILITGPTGSGKTTTLASFVRDVNKPELKIITLEDPIEYRIKGIEQTQIDDTAGYTFSRGLRSILRQDPDVILIGEMRDTETAETGVHAALTGHLVFSTLHTNDAAGAIPRLVDMGVKPYVLAPSLNMVIAQRLVRVVCSDCGEEYSPDGALRERIMESMQGVRADVFDPSVLNRKDLKFLKASEVGCSTCAGTGYKGRKGVFEIFTVQGTMEELILQGADSLRIQDEALKQGMTTIAQDAFMKVIDKISTIEEVERISEE